ncbi:MAG: hypothetical protein IJ615_02345 [Bacteroidaceae bacterium]|nr:hypothetical protein [Bacteroidaceae bacterium]
MKKIYILILCSVMAATLHAQGGFGTYLRDIIEKQEKGILGMARVIEACGLCDSLDILMDYEYENRYLRGLIPTTIQDNIMYRSAYAPEHRRYGYTLFAETDDFWLSQGIDPNDPELLGKLTLWILDNFQYNGFGYFTNDGNYESEDNLLNQWVTYHLLPHRLVPDKLVNHVNEYGYSISNPNRLTIPVTEYYVTMGKRRLLKLYESAESDGVYINRFPHLDDGRQGSGHEIACDPDKEGIRVDRENYIMDCPNAIVYPISQPLAYTDFVADNLHRTRLRFDITGLFPEFSNNDIRCSKITDDRHQYVYIPSTNTYPYLDDLTVSNDANMIYYNAWNMGWCNLNGDEVGVTGRYDVTLRLPPVPREGIYEIRYKMLAATSRSITQVYFGTDKEKLSPAGMPIDFTRNINNMQAGWQADTGDNDADQLVDTELRFNGVMKGAQSITQNGTQSERAGNQNSRYILVRQRMSPDETYYLRFKNVLDSYNKSLYMDYLEFCPESVYDSREKPEDIW